MAQAFSPGDDLKDKLRLKMRMATMANLNPTDYFKSVAGGPAPAAPSAQGGPGGVAPGMGLPPLTISNWADRFKAPAPAAPETVQPAPGYGPPSPAQSLSDRRATISARDPGMIYDMQRLRSHLDHPGAIPEGVDIQGDAAELRDLTNQRAGMTKEYNAINRAQAPVQKVQSPSEIVAARDALYNKLQVMAAMERDKGKVAAGNPTDESAFFVNNPNTREADRLSQGADKNLPLYGGGTGAAAGLEDPRVTEIRNRQGILAAKQREYREGAQTTEAMRQGGINVAGEQEGIKQAIYRRQIAEKQRELGLAGGDTAIAQAKQAGAEATIGSDPEVLRNQIMVKQAQSQGAAAMASGQKTQMTRDAALNEAGITTKEMEDTGKLIDSLQGGMSSIATGGVSGGLLGGAEDIAKNAGTARSFVTHIEQIPNPQSRQIIARELLAHMPMPDPSTGKYARWSLTGLRSGNRDVAVAHMNDIYSRLERMANGG